MTKETRIQTPTWVRVEIELKNILLQLRADRKWSQALLAEKLDVSRQTVIAIEKGRYDPSLPLAFKIGRIFDRTIEEIFDDAEEK